MFKVIRESKVTKFICLFLVFQFFLEVTGATYSYALTEGPSQPEFNSFTPISTNDMVDLASGDFNYNIPIMDVGGYPINLAYNSGVTMDQEASWVGLGWNLNIGQINRTIRGLPDDFNGDEIEHTNNMRPNVTVSVNSYINPQLFGLKDQAKGNTEGTGSNSTAGTSGASSGNSGGTGGANNSGNTGGASGTTTGGSGGANTGSITPKFKFGLEVRYNNYTGLSANPSLGVSFNLAGVTSLGLQMTASDEVGASISPSVSMTPFVKECENNTQFKTNVSAGITYNSRQGLQNFNLSSSMSSTKDKNTKDEYSNNLGSGSGSYNFNNTQFTPNGRLEFTNNQFTFSFSVGPNVASAQIEKSIGASATVQKIKYPFKKMKSYGYENTENATLRDQLDFQRENDLGVFSPATNLLPQTAYTYDLLTIQSQKVNGTFRPYRSQIGYVYDPYSSDSSTSTNASVEFQNGFGTHFGASLYHTRSINYTAGWNTLVTPFLKEKYSRKIDYQSVYYKTVGELSVNDQKTEYLQNKYGGNNPITLSLKRNNAVNRFLTKSSNSNNYGTSLTSNGNFNASDLIRENREFKNKAIQKVTKQEAIKLGLDGKFVNVNPFAKEHHTAAYLITDESGSRHVFGETVYNIEKHETSFATNSSEIDCKKGLVKYFPNEDGLLNKSGVDHFYNNIKTGPYAHTYLLSSILSPDYQDLTNNGISDDDLGTYVKFEYSKNGDQFYSNGYRWRVPFEEGMASYSEGLKTNANDEKASYLYGVKEIKYIKRIETKTHVAVFDYEVRKDGYGVNGKSGGLNSSMKTYCLKSIRLYSKSDSPFYPDGNIPSNIKPIKTAHFEYAYTLCKGIPNNILNNQNQSANGKLTLTKVYFTYQDSNLGQYTPYKFTYGQVGNQIVNKDYAPKDYDIWGNFKSNPTSCGSLTNQEYPYVEQEDREEQNILASNWALTGIDLPSGGKINITFESDDYQYVQDKRAMRMFKIHGVTDTDKAIIRQNLYSNLTSYDAKFIVIKIDPSLGLNSLSNQEIVKRYTEGLKGKPIYFDFFLKMTSEGDYEHIVGYFDMDGQPEIRTIGNDKFLYIEMKHINREGGRTSAPSFNPISVTAWFFGRQNLHRQIYKLPDPTGDEIPNLGDLLKSLVSNISNMVNIFKGENKRLYQKNCANYFDSSKSWIRLNEPTYSKIGGGSRVKKVEIFDEWDRMMDVSPNSSDIDRYKKKYGQEYTYKLSDGTSSGVASYEPNMSKENPLVMPFYFDDEKRAQKKYCETPIGSSFYPSPAVTYSRVEVKNITASDDDENVVQETRKTKSGKVVSTFYTTYDFPTISSVTPLERDTQYFYSNENNVLSNLLLTSLGVPLSVKNEMVLSQGFQIETNDMNGKLKKQEVYNYNGELISYTEDIYHTESNNPKKLKNDLVTIDSKGKVDTKAIGLDYDIVNDLRINYNSSVTTGMNANSEIIPMGAFPFWVFSGIFDYQSHDQIFKASTTTKVVHRMGILKERIAFDLGAKVSTKNLAYDSETGNVLLTETQNEFDDHYYSLNYPAYWYYDRMGLASKNIDLEGFITRQKDCEIDGKPFFKVNNKYNELVNSANTLFRLGDELMLLNVQTPNLNYTKYWVVGNNGDTNNGLILMDSNGNYLDDCGTNENTYKFRLIRSGYRNMAASSMASITLMKNPLLELDNNGHISNFNYNSLNISPDRFNRVLNVSAIEYADFWPSQQEGDMTEYPLVNSQNGLIADTPSQFPFTVGFNPYLRNVNGQFRANKSWAYLTGRIGLNSSIRNQGFLKDYNPFYKLNSDYKWEKQPTNWTFASSVSKYSPYGAELENKDALDRYSSAQYGYKYTLPMAIASNSKYNEMGFEGFEESIGNVNKHFEFKPSNGSINLNTVVSNEQSHTGKRSVKVTNGASLILKKKLSRNSNQEVMPNCPVEQCDELIEVNQPIGFLDPPNPQIHIGNTGYVFLSLPQYDNEFQPAFYTRRIKVKANCGGVVKVGNYHYSNVTIEKDSLVPDELFIIVRGVFEKNNCLIGQAMANVNHSNRDSTEDINIPIFVNSFLTYVKVSPAVAIQIEDANGQISPGCQNTICQDQDGNTNGCVQILVGSAKCINSYP